MAKPPSPKASAETSGKPASRTVRKLASEFPNAVDVHVGNRLRVRRMLAGLTQEELAAAAGITFQQVQKYEKGANRISASRLYAFANVLKVRVGWFFEDMGDPAGVPQVAGLAEDPPGEIDMMATREALELIGTYYRIATPSKRQALLALVREVSG